MGATPEENPDIVAQRPLTGAYAGYRLANDPHMQRLLDRYEEATEQLEIARKLGVSKRRRKRFLDDVNDARELIDEYAVEMNLKARRPRPPAGDGPRPKIGDTRPAPVTEGAPGAA